MIICEIRKESTSKPIFSENFTSIVKAINWMKLKEGKRVDIIDTKKHKTVRKFGRGPDNNWYDLYIQKIVS